MELIDQKQAYVELQVRAIMRLIENRYQRWNEAWTIAIQDPDRR
jgi:hypothetical protein